MVDMGVQIKFQNCWVVGCGGTGGFVAEHLARLLPKDKELFLVDHDRVEDLNLVRQNFYPEDIGKFKSEALGERLARKYQRKIGYSVHPFSAQMISRIDYTDTLYIGCVDGPVGRIELSKVCQHNHWWLDSGNGDYTGQVLIGNTTNKNNLMDNGNPSRYIPAPSLQLPALLKPLTKKQLSCTENVDQSPVINQMMATLVVVFVEKILRNELEWRGIYVDLNNGTMNPIPIDDSRLAQN